MNILLKYMSALLLVVLAESVGAQVLGSIDVHLTIKEKNGTAVTNLPNAKLSISDIGQVETDANGQFDFAYPIRNEVDPGIAIALQSEDHKMLKPVDGSIELDPSREEMFIEFLVVNMGGETPEFKKRIADLERRIGNLRAKDELSSAQINALNNTLLDTILFFEANRLELEQQIANFEDLTEDQQREIGGLREQVTNLEGQVDQLTTDLQAALEAQYLRQNTYFRDISSSLLNYVRKVKDLRDHLPFIKSYFNSAGGFRNFDDDIRAYNKIWEGFDSNRLSYLEGVSRYWKDKRLEKSVESTFDFLVEGFHQNQVLTMMQSINAELHKQKPAKAQKVATMAYDDMSINISALEKQINRMLTQLRKNI